MSMNVSTAKRMVDLWNQCLSFNTLYDKGDKLTWDCGGGKSKTVTIRTEATVIASSSCVSVEETTAMIPLSELDVA